MAEADLDRIVDYIARDQPGRAAEFGRQLRARTRALAEHPNIGRTGRPGLPAFVRELVVHRNYILFYRVLERHKAVEILRLKHARQQMP